MNLYLVSRTDGAGYEEYRSMVCAAETERAARETLPSASGWAALFPVNTLEVKFIGVAKPAP